MRTIALMVLFFTFLFTAFTGFCSETVMNAFAVETGSQMNVSQFPDLTEKIQSETTDEQNDAYKIPVEYAFWPFGKKEEVSQDKTDTNLQPKSPRKAFFLSFLFPGLGEAYVKSKRGFLFLGVEAFAWYMYISNTQDGNDMENSFHDFANTYWHYTDTYDSKGDTLTFNYWQWVKYHLAEVGYTDVKITPDNYAYIDSLLEATSENSNSTINGYSIHNLPSTKTQQYYEMIGKYPQFVYGWEDIDDETETVDANGNPITAPVNPNLWDSGTGKIKYTEAVRNINSSLRNKYESMREDSNSKLKDGQTGIYIMIVNRVISAIDAGRLAYHHNQKMNSELSMVRVQFVQKRISEKNVPMLMITKKF